MKIATLLLSLTFLTSFQSAPLVEVIGFYSNEKSKDGEHSYGYTLKLWKYDGKIIGTVAFNEGLIGDQSEELIKDVKFNEKTGVLSFSSSLLTQKLHFRGIVQKAWVTGDFTWSSWIDNNQLLKRCCKDAPIFKDYSTLSDWEKKVLTFQKSNR